MCFNNVTCPRVLTRQFILLDILQQNAVTSGGAVATGTTCVRGERLSLKKKIDFLLAVFRSDCTTTK
jgi:hypothetical protein